jgi:diguanylate cyclase (GGDEF)-like protein
MNAIAQHGGMNSSAPESRADRAKEAHRQIELMVRTEQMRSMYSQLLPGMWATVVMAAPLCWIMWPVADHLLLQIWFCAIAIAALVRTLIAIAYRRKASSEIDPLRWERLCIWPHCISGIIWGVGGMLAMPKAFVTYQILVYFYLTGISTGSASLYAVQTSVKTLTLMFFMVPATVWLFLQGQTIQLLLATSGSFLLLATIRGAQAQGSLLRHSFHLTYELRQAKATADQLARTDMLTGLNNRRAFSELSATILSQARRQGYPVAAIMLDIDFFKKINDSYGHAAGDAVLQHLARLLVQNLRKSDVCGRLGGEEFAILLPGAGIGEARLVAEKIRQTIADAPTDFEGAAIAMTSSLGVSSGSDIEEMLRAADTALYRAKHGGRNRVVCQEQEIAQSEV